MLLKNLALSTLALLGIELGALAAEPAPAAEITVDVRGAPNKDGQIRCSLYSAPDGFPKEPKKAFKRFAVTASDPNPRCRFEGLPPGRYAVAVLHDENSDGEMDTNFLGIPSEAYGASNNKLPSMSAPTFEDSKFDLAAGEKKLLVVNLKS